MKNTTAKRLGREDLKQLPGFTKIWVAGENEDDGILWHWTAPAVVFNSGEDPVIPCDLDDGLVTYEVTESFSEVHPDISFWDNEPDDAQLQGVTEAEFTSMPEPIKYKKLAHEITNRQMSFELFCEASGFDLDQFNQMITGKRNITSLSEIAEIGYSLGIDGAELIELFAS